MGPPPTADKKSKYVWNIFLFKGPSENDHDNVRIFVHCKPSRRLETRQKRKTKRGEVESFYSLKKWEWKEAYMLFTMQWSKILVLQLFTMQWSKRMILQSHDATKQKQKNYLRCNEAKEWFYNHTMQQSKSKRIIYDAMKQKNDSTIIRCNEAKAKELFLQLFTMQWSRNLVLWLFTMQ